MILEGFEIDNWACLKHVAVADLPPAGVVVLHGPNGTGKSSIIEALRACLMDTKSTTRSPGRGIPRNSTAKPRVSVTFRAGGVSYRITKQFNSKESKLESRTAAGGWKLETTDPSEAHERTRDLTGGSTSALGLHQLLWLTQAEFQLPRPKDFDGDVQARLRGVLGVLQTPLDDRFVGRVKAGWSQWFNARSKPGEKATLKKECSLARMRTTLEGHRVELAGTETRFEALEQWMEQASGLEILVRDLRRQLGESTTARDALQEEYEQSLRRLEAFQHADERVAAAEKALADAKAQRLHRAEAEQRLRDADDGTATAERDVTEQQRRLDVKAQELRTLRDTQRELEQRGRDWQAQRNAVSERREMLELQERLKKERADLQSAERLDGKLEELKKQARERFAPDAATLKQLEENRARAARARADLDAAAIALHVAPEPGAALPRLTIDGTAAPAESAAAAPIRHSVRRRAQIAIPGWGCVELVRGADARSLDQVERDLNDLDRAFAEALAPFGLAAGDGTALDQLRGRAAEKTVRDPDIASKTREIKRLAPQGLERAREAVAQLDHLVQAAAGASDLPLDAAELTRLADELKRDLAASAGEIAAAQAAIDALEGAIDGPAKGSAVRKGPQAGGLRQQEAAAQQRLTTHKATAKVLRDQLDQEPNAAQLDAAIAAASAALDTARTALAEARLSDSEATIRERLDAAKDKVRAIGERLRAAELDGRQIEAQVRNSEGLHQERAALAGRVDTLTQETERMALDSGAYDRLYALFEECREKQLGTVMKPIHDRLLRWMQVLRIGGYQSIHFNDQFLPEKLLDRDGTGEWSLDEESTGTIEQIGLMVRLALGAALATPDEPVVAVLDDPLTHSDVVRLERMRAVLKNATLGDAGTQPPAGPLQILVFTCHPEWFAMEGATTIDLAKMEMRKQPC